MVRASIADGWTTFRRHAGLLVGLQLLLFAAWATDLYVRYSITPQYGQQLGLPAGSSKAMEYLVIIGRVMIGRVWSDWLMLWAFGTALLIYQPVGAGIKLLVVQLVRDGTGNALVAVSAAYRRILSLLGVDMAFGIFFVVYLYLLLGSLFGLALAVGSGARALGFNSSLTLAAMVAGILVALSPLVVVGVGLMHAKLLVVDRQLGTHDALRGSWAMMRGYKWAGFRLAVASTVIMILGLLALGIGLIVAIPVTWGAHAAFYDRVLAANPPPFPRAAAAPLGESIAT